MRIRLLRRRGVWWTRYFVQKRVFRWWRRASFADWRACWLGRGRVNVEREAAAGAVVVEDVDCWRTVVDPVVDDPGACGCWTTVVVEE